MSSTKLNGGKDEIINILQARFIKNTYLHKNIKWKDVEKKLKQNTKKLDILQKMEETGGEPDVIGMDTKTKEYIFCDCSIESPKNRRSLCYDTNALNSRKEYKPKDSAENMAKTMGVELLTIDDYELLQSLGNFDTKTSSWIKTPENIRKLGGAIFGDKRYNHTFIYHNGAESYYASRGFRGILKV